MADAVTGWGDAVASPGVLFPTEDVGLLFAGAFFASSSKDLAAEEKFMFFFDLLLKSHKIKRARKGWSSQVAVVVV